MLRVACSHRGRRVAGVGPREACVLRMTAAGRRRPSCSKASPSRLRQPAAARPASPRGRPAVGRPVGSSYPEPPVRQRLPSEQVQNPHRVAGTDRTPPAARRAAVGSLADGRHSHAAGIAACDPRGVSAAAWACGAVRDRIRRSAGAC